METFRSICVWWGNKHLLQLVEGEDGGLATVTLKPLDFNVTYVVLTTTAVQLGEMKVCEVEARSSVKLPRV